MNPSRAIRGHPVHYGTAPWIGKGIALIERHWRLFVTVYSVIVLGIIVACGITVAMERPFDLTKRSWGGFDERPATANCYRQERTAMLLAFFLGSFGIDQFYAHHWPLAVFKLLTLGAGGIWWFVDVVLWMVGGVYGTPGCPGGSEHSWQY
ncbi:hypothetical protein BFJ63_vAg16581 [Fusarium oxysporum f. sp. narcissi]|uniref:TM2 domain-containing protein n=1 Tax=Fusarium oxysporum f. sp. narcissi TaxID=451672 RepID=A0A4Q2V748_FUSOX|nr:hypothetical protein BFJ63_vAg16581 [Fusarium oxysporum f. sp. narcissi]